MLQDLMRSAYHQIVIENHGSFRAFVVDALIKASMIIMFMPPMIALKWLIKSAWGIISA